MSVQLTFYLLFHSFKLVAKKVNVMFSIYDPQPMFTTKDFVQFIQYFSSLPFTLCCSIIHSLQYIVSYNWMNL